MHPSISIPMLSLHPVAHRFVCCIPHYTGAFLAPTITLVLFVHPPVHRCFCCTHQHTDFCCCNHQHTDDILAPTSFHRGNYHHDDHHPGTNHHPGTHHYPGADNRDIFVPQLVRKKSHIVVNKMHFSELWLVLRMFPQTRSLKRVAWLPTAVINTTHSLTALAIVVAECKTWCSKRAKPWSDKCKWWGRCDNCPECSGTCSLRGVCGPIHAKTVS